LEFWLQPLAVTEVIRVGAQQDGQWFAAIVAPLFARYTQADLGDYRIGETTFAFVRRRSGLPCSLSGQTLIIVGCTYLRRCLEESLREAFAVINDFFDPGVDIGHIRRMPAMSCHYLYCLTMAAPHRFQSLANILRNTIKATLIFPGNPIAHHHTNRRLRHRQCAINVQSVRNLP
jgi:hypothetical protein